MLVGSLGTGRSVYAPRRKFLPGEESSTEDVEVTAADYRIPLRDPELRHPPGS